MEDNNLPKIGISLGDVNGIGPEVVIKALQGSRLNKICIPILYGSGKHLSKWKNMLGFGEWQFTTVKNASQALPKQVNLVNCLTQDYFELNVGEATKEAGQLAFDSLQRAVTDLREGQIDALVTAPINKDAIQNESFKFPGHTEYLAEAFNATEVLMFMISDKLRMGVVTGHVPLEKVKITPENLSSKLKAMLQSLKHDFGIQKPKIAVLGLNPHAGENGLLGDTEKIVIEPTLDNFRKKGQLVFGPFPADGFFATQSWQKYDAVLAMYHDQGLTPFKMLAFEDGVNFTAGLPSVRTSPDHGTAYGIAGQKIAEPTSMLHAIYAAIDITKQRQENAELKANSLNLPKIKEELAKNAKGYHQ